MNYMSPNLYSRIETVRDWIVRVKAHKTKSLPEVSLFLTVTNHMYFETDFKVFKIYFGNRTTNTVTNIVQIDYLKYVLRA